MKVRMLSIILAIMLSITSFAQVAENSCIKGEVSGLTATGQVIITMTNKQSCLADIGYDIGLADIADKHVLPGESDTFNITVTGPTTLLLETNTNCDGGCDQTHLPLLVDIVATPVTGLSTFAGTYDKDSHAIIFTWTTFTEINNNHFELMQDGNSIATIKSRASDGNSSDPINYGYFINTNNKIGQEFGIGGIILIICLGLLVKGDKRKWLIAPAFCMLLLMACKKDHNEFNGLSGRHEYSLKQVDNDGKFEYSHIIVLNIN